MMQPMMSTDYEQKSLNLLEAGLVNHAQVLATLSLVAAIREHRRANGKRHS
jgi:hypothetical protein